MSTDPGASPAPPDDAPPEAVRRALKASVYPLPDPGEDKRFRFGLIADLADVLVDHDYPPPEPADFVRLMQLLFRFLYRDHT